MARKHEHQAAETLQEIESLGDRLLEWVSNNPTIVFGTAIGILVMFGGYGLTRDFRESAADSASASLARVQEDYRRAMGATPGALVVPEPANPETAREARTRFLAEFQAVATEHTGKPAGGLAALEAGELQVELGEPEAALETWNGAVGSLAGEVVSALLLSRMAAAHDDAGRWAQAAESYEAAADVEGYPLVGAALAEAARCWVAANESDRALQAYDRIETEAPNFQPPDYIRSRIDELRAARSSG